MASHPNRPPLAAEDAARIHAAQSAVLVALQLTAKGGAEYAAALWQCAEINRLSKRLVGAYQAFLTARGAAAEAGPADQGAA
jgi:hypothetical protein